MSAAPKNSLLKAISKDLPLHKENKRIWIATPKLHETDLAENYSYHYEINKRKKQVKIVSSLRDDRKITLRKSNNMPIIDINNQEITNLFAGIDKITIKIFQHEIIIEPLKEAIMQQSAKAKMRTRDITFFDIFAGSGTLSKALSDSGIRPVGAIEYDDGYLENYEKNNPNIFTYNTNVSNIDYELLHKNITVLSGGIPCENYSLSGITKQCSLGRGTKEAGHTGSLGYFFLQAVERIRPAVVLIEEVVGFQKSAMADIIRSVLSFRGYKVSETILTGTDYGSMTKRKRFCMVATISNTPFEFSKQKIMNFRSVADILEVSVEDRVWLDRENSKSIAYSLDKEQAHIKKGQGFRFARTYLTDTITKTITKGYYKNRLTDPILVHPEDENRFSWFTPRELARINGLPDDFILPEAKTKAGEIIGQGVCYEAFCSVANDIINHIKED